jgi:type II secretory pathway pseudopilin PulG
VTPRPRTVDRRIQRVLNSQGGFSLVELLVASGIMLVIYAVVMSGLGQLITTQASVWNRTEMHSGVRNTTELLQQEVGQAGLVTLPGAVTTTNAVAIGATSATVNSSAGMFVGELLTIDTGGNRETVKIGAVAGTTITLDAAFNPGGFTKAHVNSVPVSVFGGFASGIVPCASLTACPGSLVATATPNGSTGTVLKLYGDINGDGNMVYIEYTCDTNAGSLYRNMMAWNAGAKPTLTTAQLLIDNITPNPGGASCFTYQQQVVGANTFVTDVAITLTVRTQMVDPATRQFQTETKALLNVSPRNVFNVWELASQGFPSSVQPMPAQVQALLP